MKTVQEDYLADRAAHLLALAKAFDAAGRPIPGHILAALARCRSSWKKRKDVPPSVVAAIETLRRTKP